MQCMTIGCQGFTVETFFDALVHAHVQTLVDVRELPLSRKRGFSKTALQKTAQTYNIKYVHMRALGCPRPIRHNYREDKNWQTYVRRYNEYLYTQDDAVATLATRMRCERCCLLCMEANPNFCHRSLISKRIGEIYSGVDVVDITPPAIAIGSTLC